MARCPDCGHMNDDSRKFCTACGSPLDPDVRLIQSIEKSKRPAAEPVKKQEEEEKKKKPIALQNDDDDYEFTRHEEEKSSAVPWVIAGLVAIAVIVACVLLLK
ncbi:MAG: zinc ribbon domain-containing protein [Oscillospiraceae bacterium]|nr:zinc ribbon domain-containing protein [Oscillospiraceae bacterium]